MSLDKLPYIRRTVRPPLADCPQYTYANPPEATTSLEQFLTLPADCPALLGGPSAVNVANPPETAMSLDNILNSTADCPHQNGGPSAVQSCEPPPETSSLDKLQISTADRPLPYSGLSTVNFAIPPVAVPPKLIRLKCANHHRNGNQG